MMLFTNLDALWMYLLFRFDHRYPFFLSFFFKIRFSFQSHYSLHLFHITIEFGFSAATRIQNAIFIKLRSLLIDNKILKITWNTALQWYIEHFKFPATIEMNHSHMKIHFQNSLMVSSRKRKEKCLFCMHWIHTHAEREKERKRRRPVKENWFVWAKKKVDCLLTDMLTLAHWKTECLNSRHETKMTESNGLFFALCCVRFSIWLFLPCSTSAFVSICQLAFSLSLALSHLFLIFFCFEFARTVSFFFSSRWFTVMKHGDTLLDTRFTDRPLQIKNFRNSA